MKVTSLGVLAIVLVAGILIEDVISAKVEVRAQRAGRPRRGRGNNRRRNRGGSRGGGGRVRPTTAST